MHKRQKLLHFLALGTIGLLLVSLVGVAGLAWLYRDKPNYSRIEDGLYMGGNVANPPPGTRAVLNLCETEDPYRAEVHLWKGIRDSAPAPSIDWLREVVEFVDARRQEGRTTYVHCQNGVSRSGMVVTAYLMHRHGWSRDEALAFVRSKRPGVRPHQAFMERLAEWEQVLKAKAGDGKK